MTIDQTTALPVELSTLLAALNTNPAPVAQQPATKPPTAATAGFQAAPCPDWCELDQRADVGHPDEFLVHTAPVRTAKGFDIELRQVEFPDNHRERPFIYLNGNELSVPALCELTTALLLTLTDATDSPTGILATD